MGGTTFDHLCGKPIDYNRLDLNWRSRMTDESLVALKKRLTNVKVGFELLWVD